MADSLLCSQCGGPLFAGRCLPCDTRRWSRFLHREVVRLVVLAVVAAAAFLATRAIAADDEQVRRNQATSWFAVAQEELRAGRVSDGLAALRRAAIKDPENVAYGLALAGALAQGGRDDEARRQLLKLRGDRPEDPDINLQLARLEARAGDAAAARRYYENAVAALWRPEQADRRRAVRVELIDMLLARDERARALSELLVLEANLPAEVAVRVQVGRRFLQAGDPSRALDHFGRALREQPEHRNALAGAGEAAFALGDYARARRYLDAVAGDAERLAGLRDVAGLVLAGDPLAPRLGAAERRRRMAAAIEQAALRLDACQNASPAGSRAELESLQAEARLVAAALNRRAGGRDIVEDGLDLVYRMEREAEERCATPAAPFDRALLLIGRRHGFGEM